MVGQLTEENSDLRSMLAEAQQKVRTRKILVHTYVCKLQKVFPIDCGLISFDSDFNETRVR